MLTLLAAMVLTVSLVSSLTGCASIALISLLVDDLKEDTTDSWWNTVETDDWWDTKPTDAPETEPWVRPDDGGINMVYTEIDKAEFFDLCERLKIAVAAGEDKDTIFSLYDQIYYEYGKIADNGSALYLLYAYNPTDEYYAQQNVDYSVIQNECWDAALKACREVATVSEFADEFKDYVGEEAFQYMVEYEDITDYELDFIAKEQELQNEYEEYCADPNLSQDQLMKKVGPIFVELVKMRNELAQFYGYDNYCDYADAEVYMRDYGTEEARNFHKQVKRVSSYYYDFIYNTSAYFGLYYGGFDFTSDELLEGLGTVTDKIGTIAAENYDKLVDNNLYDMTVSDSKMDANFCITFDGSSEAFIFMNPGTSRDFVTLSHEFGHFINNYVSPAPNLLTSFGSYDLLEIHSNGLQALCSEYYDEIYGAYAEDAEAFNLIDLLGNVIDGCILDEFQREVYTHPNWTLDDINACYQRIAAEYGDPSTGPDDYWWIYVNHNFESPMYYISYAASGIAAIQIWEMSQDNYQDAVDAWEMIQRIGAYDEEYMDVLERVGLETFADDNTVSNACFAVFDRLDEITYRY